MFTRKACRVLMSTAALVVVLSLGVLPVFSAGSSVVGYSVDSDDADWLWRIELATGCATAIGPTGFGDIESLSFSADGTLHGVDQASGQLVTCDLSTGACTAVGPLGVTFWDTGLTFDAAGNLWMSTDDPPPYNFYSLDPASGAAALVGSQGQKVTGLAFRGGVVYGLGGLPPNVLVTVNTGTGLASPVGLLGAISLLDGGIDFDAAGVLWGIEDQGNIFRISPATGAATLVASVVDESGAPHSGFEGLAITQLGAEGLVPEPGSVLLLCTGLAGLGGYAALRLRAAR